MDIGQLTLDDGQLCPAELEQALQGDSLLLMACSAGYYQLAQVLLNDFTTSENAQEVDSACDSVNSRLFHLDS